MKEPLNIERILASDGVQVGTCDNRNAANPGDFTDIVDKAKSTGEGMIVTPEGGIHSARDKNLAEAMEKNPEIAKAIQVLKDFKISF